LKAEIIPTLFLKLDFEKFQFAEKLGSKAELEAVMEAELEAES